MVYWLKDNRVWRSYSGGRRLDAYALGEVPESDSFPEEWVASTVVAFNPGRQDAVVEGLSRCTDGTPLKEIIDREPERMLGREMVGRYGARMSILVKLLDASERLPIQCHPTRAFAREHFGSPFGKAECWYILDAAPGACVYAGFNETATREKWQRAFDEQDAAAMLAMLHRFDMTPGDVLYIDGGVPHAIGGGCLMVELQEPTDLMVIPEKVTPSGRVLPDEKLHGGLGFEKMMDCFEYEPRSFEKMREKYFRHPESAEGGVTPIVGADLTDAFAMDEIRTSGAVETEFAGRYAVAIVLSGEGEAREGHSVRRIRKGDKCFIAADTEKVIWTSTGEAPLRVALCRPR